MSPARFIVIDPKKVRSYLALRSMNQQDLAEKIPMHPKALSLLLSSKEDRTTRQTTINRIAEILGVNPRDITKASYQFYAVKEEGALPDTEVNESITTDPVRKLEFSIELSNLREIIRSKEETIESLKATIDILKKQIELFDPHK